MRALIARFWNDTRGATAIEYALIAGIISISIVVALQLISTSLDGKYTSVSNSFSN